MTRVLHGDGFSRRGFLAGIGGAAATLAISTATSAQDDTGDDDGGQAAEQPSPALALAEIQGNVLAGFNKDHQALVLFSFPPDAARARAWLESVRTSVAATPEVAAHNAAFRAAVQRDGTEANAPTATWVNLALSHAGLAALGRPRAELLSFPEEFRVGMRRRAELIGDRGPSDPATWPQPYRRAVSGVVIIAADVAADLDDAIASQIATANEHGVEVIHVERGETRVDQPGHEHFGFRDGLSQPGVRGFTPVGGGLVDDTAEDPEDDAEEDAEESEETEEEPEAQGIPGQDLLWPGEFVLGYPRQAGAGGGDGQGPLATSGPAWTKDGSYLVFRRLRQDVRGFRDFVKGVAAQQGISVDLAGAKLVGRYRSGAPLAATGPVADDPGIADPSLLSDAKVVNFEFAEEHSDGLVIPHAAHIRKTYPRDDDTEDGGEEDTQTHRLMRRGIPYGPSYDESDPQGSAPIDRGLLFLAYQTSIARQFEFVQRRWVNDPDHPTAGAGHDPVMATIDGTGTFRLPGGAPDHVALMQRFVTTAGGDYFLQPSMSALALLATPPAVSAPAPAPRGPRDGGRDRRGPGRDGPRRPGSRRPRGGGRGNS